LFILILMAVNWGLVVAVCFEHRGTLKLFSFFCHNMNFLPGLFLLLLFLLYFLTLLINILLFKTFCAFFKVLCCSGWNYFECLFVFHFCFFFLWSECCCLRCRCLLWPYDSGSDVTLIEMLAIQMSFVFLVAFF